MLRDSISCVFAVCIFSFAAAVLGLAQTTPTLTVNNATGTGDIADFVTGGGTPTIRAEIDPLGYFITGLSGLFAFENFTTGNRDTAISRDSTGGSGVFDFGKGNPNDKSGTLNAATVNVGTVNATSGYQLNGTTIQASAILVSFCLGGIGTTGGTFVLAPAEAATTANCSATTNAVEVPMPYTCTAKNLYAVAGTAGNNANSGITTLYVDNTASTLGGNITGGCVIGTGTSCSDTTHTVTINAGHKWSVRTTSNGSGETLANVRVAFQCQ